MKRFYHVRRPHPLRGIAVSVLVCCCLLWLMMLAGKTLSERNRKEEQLALEIAIRRGVIQCYAEDGQYPENLRSLCTKTGLTYDNSRFFVDYTVRGKNIYPVITVINTEEEMGR